MKQWWLHHVKQIRLIEDSEDRATIEDLTGRIPLLLRPFLDLGDKPFDDVTTLIRGNRELSIVGANIRRFSAMKRSISSTDYER